MSSIERMTAGRTIWALILATGAVVGSVRAAEQSYVLPDGRKVALQKSDSEFAVTMRDGADVASGARRLASQGRGVIKDLTSAPRSRYKLLQVADTTPQRRALVRQDPAIEAVRPVYRFPGSDAPVMCSGTLVARVRKDTTAADRAELWRQHRLRELRPVSGVPDVYVLEPVDDECEAVDAAALLAADSRVRWSQPNFRRVRQPRQVAPADQFYIRQWHLNNTGQSLGTPDADIDAPEAWLVSEGQDVLFGMFDDGCDVEHEDLRDRYKGNGQDASLQFNDPDYDNPSPKQIFDRHGTAVMGLAVASANSLGVRGVAYLGRFTASRGLSEPLTAEEVATVYTFARQEDVDVHINSWGIDGAPNEAAVEDAIRIAFREGRPVGDDNLGMVIVFASGNSGVENVTGFEYSTMPEVIGVGACNDDDELASYSNYGANINVLAPSGDDFHGAMATTDNSDSGDFVEDGYNVGGFDDFGFPDLDGRGLYTGTFSGTSAACPVVAGVAGLIVSRNTLLTATDVRLVLEHTCDQINIAEAEYNGITSRSARYGYGRINAKAAVDAASDSLTNGTRTWPDRAANVSVSAGTLTWKAGVGTEEYLVVESAAPFGFIPEDGACYHADQLGCATVALTALPNGVTALAPESCDGPCTVGDERSAAFLLPGGKKYFGIYARSAIGRYSFGVSVDSEGNIIDGGPTVDGGGGGGGSGDGDGGGVVEPEPPRVTINVSPLEGESPLTVQFNGNAVSSRPIDEDSIAWDFDVGSGVSVDASERTVSHTYEVLVGEQTFIAQLTMKDEDGRPGTAQVQIRVRSSTSQDSGSGGLSDVRIIVGVPGNIDADLDEGTSPFEVELKVDATTLAGTFVSVVWDLGDGTRASSQVVPHTFVNTSGQAQVFPVTAIVSTVLGSSTIQTTATRLITVQSGDVPADPPPVDLPGTGADGPGGRAGCSAIGLIPMLGMMSGLCLLRRRTA